MTLMRIAYRSVINVQHFKRFASVVKFFQIAFCATS